MKSRHQVEGYNGRNSLKTPQNMITLIKPDPKRSPNEFRYMPVMKHKLRSERGRSMVVSLTQRKSVSESRFSARLQDFLAMAMKRRLTGQDETTRRLEAINWLLTEWPNLINRVSSNSMRRWPNSVGNHWPIINIENLGKSGPKLKHGFFCFRMLILGRQDKTRQDRLLYLSKINFQLLTRIQKTPVRLTKCKNIIKN